MKKFIILILCIQILNLPAIATEAIADTFAEKTLVNKRQIELPQQKQIEDDFANSTLKGRNLTIKQTTNEIVKDIFAERTLPPNKYQTITHKQSPIADNLTDKIITSGLQTSAIKKSTPNYNFDSDTRIPMKIAVNEYITTKRPMREGQELSFRVLNDVKINNQLTIKKDTTVKARLETISLNQSFGVPADIVVERFTIKRLDQPDISLDGSIHKIGANRSLWVYPVGYVGLCFFFIGAPVFAIRGGHAKLTTKEVYEVYYVPNL